MIHCHSIGIVLKKHAPRRQKISVLDKQLGRIEVIPVSMHAAQALSNGALVEYTVYEYKNSLMLKDIQVVQVPVYSVTLDMLFFHHILEMIYFGVPLEGVALDIFELVVAIQENLSLLSNQIVVQKLLLAQLCILLGAEAAPSIEPLLSNVSNKRDISWYMTYTIEQVVEHDLDQWMYQYIQSHPFVHLFKTIQFLNDVRRV